MPIKVELTIPVELYTYSELSERAKEAPRATFLEHWIDNWEAQEIIRECKEEAIDYGFIIDNVQYTGFHSQGDGACWTGGVAVLKFIEKFGGDSIGFEGWRVLYNEISAGVRINIERSMHSNYYHSGTMCVDASDFDILDYVSINECIKTESILKGMTIDDVRKLIHADEQCRYKTPEDIHNFMLDEAKKYADLMYSKLRQQYEHMSSDEYISECYDCNDVYFNKEGGRVDDAIVAIYLHQTEQINK